MSKFGSLLQHITEVGKASAAIAHDLSEHLNMPFVNNKSQTQALNQDKPIPLNNAFTKIIKAVKLLPESSQSFVFTKTFSKIVPYVGTTGITYEKVTPNELIVSLNNKRNVQNHIGSIHAVAVTLLAETATGFILGINLPSDRVLLVKSYEVNFYKPLKKGQVAAIATLSDEQRQYILDNPKGDMVIPCVIEDRNSNADRDPITVEMTWAWIPKSELKERQQAKSN